MNWILAPLAGLYAIGLKIRHLLYDEHLLPSFSVVTPTICVGNLAVGGTGKTPTVEYLVELLSNRYKVAVLSRGYGRKTRGFLLAGEDSTAVTIGDEPMQLHQRFPNLLIAVSEDRVRGVRRLTKQHPEIEVIILDDAFQHRRLRAGLNILLTEYNNLYVHDHLLPIGTLRDLRSRATKADIVLVTKCPELMQAIDRRVVSNHLSLAAFQQLVFSRIHHAPLPLPGRPLVVTGVANPKPMMDYVLSYQPNAVHLRYADHHVFRARDVETIVTEAAKCDYVLTTEKDGVRMAETALPQLLGERLQTLPIRMEVDEDFDRIVLQYVERTIRKNQLPTNRVRIQS